MALDRWFGRRRVQPAAAAAHLYVAAVEQARRPEFYLRCAVPDTLDGRFELIALHTFLAMHRLAAESDQTSRDIAQALFDRLFADMDRSLREMGVGDMGIGRRIQQMAQGFYGRMAAYRQALADGDAALDSALRRNLYGTVEVEPGTTALLVAYVRRAVAELADQPVDQLGAGRIAFPLPPGGADREELP